MADMWLVLVLLRGRRFHRHSGHAMIERTVPMSLTRRTLLLAAPAVLAARPGRAQASWPTRPVRLISSSPPAGASDILTRTVGNALQAQLGQSFVVENKPGGGGLIGSDFVAKSPPDGYTWLTTNVGSQ